MTNIRRFIPSSGDNICPSSFDLNRRHTQNIAHASLNANASKRKKKSIENRTQTHSHRYYLILKLLCTVCHYWSDPMLRLSVRPSVIVQCTLKHILSLMLSIFDSFRSTAICSVCIHTHKWLIKEEINDRRFVLCFRIFCVYWTVRPTNRPTNRPTDQQHWTG